ncbi:MAG: DUF1295 domain-containing protein [Deltaproteobacteria bacterium]|nr:MAG: DUF1295 domain-containing protein [Deltaproteobacteria bacterium]
MAWVFSSWFAGSWVFVWAWILALALSALGFWRTVYFVSLGYALSITSIAVLAGVQFSGSFNFLVTLHCTLLVLYGVRLGSYLLPRERKASYRETVQGEYSSSSDVSFVGKTAIWISVALLYVLMSSPLLYHCIALEQGRSLAPGTVLIGLSIMFVGLGLETLADLQKSAYKKKHPKRFCDVGLYRWVRCPNYFGEMTFWTGNWVVGLSALSTLGTWVLSLLGLVSIWYIMLYSTHRLERTQIERYGEMEEFQTYCESTPILFPFVPLYSLKRMSFMLKY